MAGFCTVIALCRAGIQIFWAEPDRAFPQVRVSEIASVLLLLGLCLLLTVVVEGPLRYLGDAAAPVPCAGQLYPRGAAGRRRCSHDPGAGCRIRCCPRCCC